ncbi:hypothetical protein CAC42_1210 [Sphaceloma murrayae]|uniref:NAD(P)-binding domain-containing protein n=1 Tax=Sphaceloma murrayae TaxID=2082308 RepID=A0A2K1R2C0_9PEZI|nr:hypothetical protein CAC42_1210 [Sphaceloma murrayae]
MTDSNTIALLGATGQTGRQTLEQLLQKPDVNVHVYVRSKSKLLQQSPSVAGSSRVKICEGAVTDVTTIKACVRGAGVIISTLGGNDNRPMTVIKDALTSLVSALAQLRQETKGTWQKPLVLMLSSSTWNKRNMAQMPSLLHFVIHRAFWYPYVDVLAGHGILEGAGDLLKPLLVQPPLLVDDTPTGYELSTEKVGLSIAYEDLGGAFTELATNQQYWDLGAVMPFSRGGDQPSRYAPIIVGRVSRGLLASYVPGFWAVCDRLFG